MSEEKKSAITELSSEELEVVSGAGWLYNPYQAIQKVATNYFKNPKNTLTNLPASIAQQLPNHGVYGGGW
ncbi:MAG: hypothetical protein JO235_18510 [Chroococcidiopsidaceae cyanobacterium CP_BM_RX_35]|nr:hypothetical protein [Chroococcidiopsidaceae cyanobacterium CP_BM_RX_35]